MRFENKNFTILNGQDKIYMYDNRDGFSMTIPHSFIDLNTLIKHLIKISTRRKTDTLNMESYIDRNFGSSSTYANWITVRYIKEYLPYLKIMNNDFSDIDNIDIANLKLVYQELLRESEVKNETSSSRKRKNNGNP